MRYFITIDGRGYLIDAMGGGILSHIPTMQIW